MGPKQRRSELLTKETPYKPYAGKPHVRICAGGARQLASLPLKRRAFIAALGGAAAWPLVARGQQSRMPVVGFLSSRSLGESASVIAAFRRGLSENGYIEGQNVAVEYRWAEGGFDRLPAMAADLVSRQVALITAFAPPAALAAKFATSTIPVVFISGIDPVKADLVASLNRPGGNLTGISLLTTDLGAKRLGLLRELVPKAELIGLLVNPNSPEATTQREEMEVAAHAVGLKILGLDVGNERDFEPAFAALTQARASGLLVARTHSSPAGANGSLRWRRVMLCRPSTSGASLSWSAA